MTEENNRREKITQYCSVCNSIVETEVIFNYYHHIEQNIDELRCDGTVVKLVKCLNCENPILLSEDFIEIEDNHFPQVTVQLYPEKESAFVANAPQRIIKPYKEAIKCFKANAYEASVVMCRKGIDAICDDLGENKGTLINKLKKLKDKGLLENTFYNWSNELREIGNLGAHSHDIEITKQDAKDTLEFFEALILYLYHLVDKYNELIKRKKYSKSL
jgi:hypothetical protein